MLKLQEMTYVTVITVEFPDPAGKGTCTVRASVNLLPEEMVQVVQADADAGHVTLKAVRDCTLAELAAFADDLEGDIPSVYQQISLADIGEARNGTLTFGLIQDRAGEQPTAEELLNGAAVVFPVGFKQPAGAVPKNGPDDSPPVETDPAEEGLVDLAQLQEAEPEPELDPIEITILNGDDAVADQASAVPFEPQTAEHNRLAGRKLELDTQNLAACDILFMEEAFVDASNHALTSMHREVAGFIIGPPPEERGDGRFVVHVTQMIPAEHTVMQGASVTYTPESWRTITDWLLENYPNEEQIILGWYHTHPGFGIFLSNMDLFIHQNFFSQKWHIALVLDPVNRRSGYFCWDREQKKLMPYDMQWPYWAHSTWYGGDARPKSEQDADDQIENNNG